MTSLFTRLSTLHQDRRAVTALEYGLIAAAVIAVSLSAFTLVGDNLSTKMDAIAELMT